MRQVIKHRDIRLLNMIRRTDPVIPADFSCLRELFHFNGIPHYETITPDCRRVRDDLQLQGFYNFDYELTRLKERLK